MRQLLIKGLTEKKFFFIIQMMFVVFLCCFFGSVAVFLGQDANWDFKNYHWYDGYAFSHHRMEWDIAPAHLQTYFNPLLDAINYAIIQSFPPKVAEFILGTFHGIAVYFFIWIAYLVFKRHPPPLHWYSVFFSVLIGVTGAASFAQIGTTYNEPMVTAFVMAALLLAVRAIQEEKESAKKQINRWLFSAFILGLGLGLKLTAISYVVGFLMAYLFYQKLQYKHLILVFPGIIFLLTGFLMTDGFWMWILFKKFHNPFFPLYNNIFHSPYIAVSNFVDRHQLPKNFIQALLYPFYGVKRNAVFQGLPVLDRRLAAVVVLGILLFIQLLISKIRRRFQFSVNAEELPNSSRLNNNLIIFLSIFFFVSYGTWLLEFAIYRYTIPICFLSGILIVDFSLRFFSRVNRQLAICFLITGFLILTTVQLPSTRMSYSKNFVEVQVPPIASQSLVLLMSTAPLAYLIPYFPHDTHFVGFYNSFIIPKNTLIFQQVVDRITRYKASVYVIMKKDFLGQATAILNQYGLKMEDHCLIIQSNLEKEPIPLCPIKGNGYNSSLTYQRTKNLLEVNK